MKRPFTKLLFTTAAAAAVLTSCGGGGDSEPSGSISQTKMLSPQHLSIQGRMNSTITIEGVRYPRIDGTYSEPGIMVLTIEENPLPDGPVYASYSTTGMVQATFPPVHDGEIQHSVTNIGGQFTEGPFGTSMAFNAPQANNSVASVQLAFDDLNGDRYVKYLCDEFALTVTGVDAQPQGDPYQDYEDNNNVNNKRIVQDFHMRYTGVVVQGIIKISSNVPADGWPLGFEGEINLSGCPFVWECDETRVDYAYEQNTNPGQPIIGL